MLLFNPAPLAGNARPIYGLRTYLDNFHRDSRIDSLYNDEVIQDSY
jgi:hypothetical protein